MTREPRTTAPDDLAAAAVGSMERHGVIVLPVISEAGTIEGVVHLHDLMRAGAV
jgi:arabinose-5-phosphate isomerase